MVHPFTTHGKQLEIYYTRHYRNLKIMQQNQGCKHLKRKKTNTQNKEPTVTYTSQPPDLPSSKPTRECPIPSDTQNISMHNLSCGNKGPDDSKTKPRSTFEPTATSNATPNHLSVSETLEYFEHADHSILQGMEEPFAT